MRNRDKQARVSESGDHVISSEEDEDFESQLSWKMKGTDRSNSNTFYGGPAYNSTFQGTWTHACMYALWSIVRRLGSTEEVRGIEVYKLIRCTCRYKLVPKDLASFSIFGWWGNASPKNLVLGTLWGAFSESLAIRNMWVCMCLPFVVFSSVKCCQCQHWERNEKIKREKRFRIVAAKEAISDERFWY